METLRNCLMVGAIVGIYYNREKLAGRKGIIVGFGLSLASAIWIISANFLEHAARLSHMTSLQVTGLYITCVLILTCCLSIPVSFLVYQVAKTKKQNQCIE